MPVEFRFSTGRGAFTCDVSLQEAREQILTAMRDVDLIEVTDVTGQRHLLNPHHLVDVAEIEK
jgi:hypothetical protein